VFGRWTKQETLLDPEDVAAGHVVRFRRSDSERVVRSRRPAHPAIVSVEEFTEAQLLRRSRAAGGLGARRKLERGPKITKYAYPLRGRMRCGYCGRRMEGTPRKAGIYYRCAARRIAPGSPALRNHPKNVYLRERAVLGPVNAWIGRLFDTSTARRQPPSCARPIQRGVRTSGRSAPVGRSRMPRPGFGDSSRPSRQGRIRPLSSSR
jgi:Recombinase zinc beta ribbon domain